MKTVKLILTILKNLFLIILEEIVKLFTIPRRRKWTIIVIIIAAIGFGGYKGWKYYHPSADDQNLSLAQAAKIGQVTTHKLMVQIENRNCPPEIASGCYERGDIVLIKEGGFEFSDAEKTGFLILNMDLTDKQAEVLVKALDKNSGKKGPDGQPMKDQLKMRKYAVDLKKIGLDNDTTGKVVDTIYKWDVVKEK